MTDTTEIQGSEGQHLHVDNAAASAVDTTTHASVEGVQDEGFEIVLKDDETKPKQDPATNAHFAAKRLERKRQRELEQQMEAVKRGEVPENLRVNPELPPQPNASDYLAGMPIGHRPRSLRPITNGSSRRRTPAAMR